MVLTWEGKSSWAGVVTTKPGRVFVYWVDFTSNGERRDRLVGGGGLPSSQESFTFAAAPSFSHRSGARW